MQVKDDLKRKARGGAPPSPLDLRVLSALHHASQGGGFSQGWLNTGISEQVLAQFYPHFTAWMRRTYSSEWIRIPSTVEELQADVRRYTILGFPGGVGSMDGVHVECIAAFTDQHAHVGKEGYSTVSFNVTSNRSRIMHVAGVQQGNRPDTCTVRSDAYVQAVREKELFTGFEFLLYNAAGVRQRHKGAWIICDNGYHRWAETICPIKRGNSRAEHRWSKRVESVRKVRRSCTVCRAVPNPNITIHMSPPYSLLAV